MMLGVLMIRGSLWLIVVLILLLSGGSVVSRGVSRRGDAVLRRAFYLAALTAIKVNPVIKRFYEEHKGRLKGKKLIVACAMLLLLGLCCIIISHLMLTGDDEGFCLHK
ncbi:Partial transposase in ISC1190 [Saccharolobus solfataricus P2]|uniref:Partial transposase in ISC1190 n=2 Tax=Saccharolobus solfataricus TaxID=2287 RepID=Q7LXH0_SACS2|nr:Partial transposase in ISC1190 [Saccharolobus solfataricus P2]CAB57500.1 hypothetical protein [Saccharolobus solfataricus P2]SAI84394.1 transposase [Saccharolobus solfataricus]